MQYFSWDSILPQVYFIGQVILAVILGGAVGWQREIRGKAAGARTYALVTGGSALFTILSISAFPADPARVSAQIITGIGFLGAGAILHKESRIVGLTTAAGLWISAAIGMAVGLRYYFLAVVGTLVVLAVLMINEKKIAHVDDLHQDEIEEA
ncbi:MAG: MgtC/SapB family protein [Candidatus Magasanikbacteria bacterium]|nr:MgtC/SapB family protein [Candidatus Magasanikbacteria bacterium]